MAVESQGLVENLETLPGEDSLIIAEQLSDLSDRAKIIDDEIAERTRIDKQSDVDVARVRTTAAEESAVVGTRVEQLTAEYNPLADLASKATRASFEAGRIPSKLAVASALQTRHYAQKRPTAEDNDQQLDRFDRLQPGTSIIICDDKGQFGHNHTAMSGKLKTAAETFFDPVDGRTKLRLTLQDDQEVVAEVDSVSTMAIGEDETRGKVFDLLSKWQKLPEVASQDFGQILSQIAKLKPLWDELPDLAPFKQAVTKHTLIGLRRALDRALPSYRIPDTLDAVGKLRAIDHDAFDLGLRVMVSHPNFTAWDEAAKMVATATKPNYPDLSEADKRTALRQAHNKLNTVYQRQRDVQPQLDETS